MPYLIHGSNISSYTNTPGILTRDHFQKPLTTLRRANGLCSIVLTVELGHPLHSTIQITDYLYPE